MQRDLVERAMAGDHDAFSELARVSIGRLYVVARLILRDDRAGRGRDPGGPRGRLAATLRPARPRPIRGLAPSPAGQRVLSRSAPRPTAGEHRDPGRPARDAGSVGSARPGLRPRRSRSTRARLPTPRRRSANGARHALLPRVQPRRRGGGPRHPAGDGPLPAPSRHRMRCGPPSRPTPEARLLNEGRSA